MLSHFSSLRRIQLHPVLGEEPPLLSREVRAELLQSAPHPAPGSCRTGRPLTKLCRRFFHRNGGNALPRHADRQGCLQNGLRVKDDPSIRREMTEQLYPVSVMFTAAVKQLLLHVPSRGDERRPGRSSHPSKRGLDASSSLRRSHVPWQGRAPELLLDCFKVGTARTGEPR